MNPKETSDINGVTSFHAEFPGGFAVLMGFYYHNDPHLFEIAVDSIFSNTLQPSQFVLVADGPLSEGLEKRLQSLQQRYSNRIDLLRLPVNLGHALALNAGLQYINLPWIVRADVDDFNLPHRFAALATLLASQPDLDLMSSSILEVEATGQPIAIKSVPCIESEIHQYAKTRNPFNHMAVAYRREVVLACGGYPNVHLREDYALWCYLLARRSRVANTSEVLVHATAGLDMYHRRGGWRYAKAEWKLQNLMVSCGLKSRVQAWRDCLLRILVSLAPAVLRGKVYELFLRKPMDSI